MQQTLPCYFIPENQPPQPSLPTLKWCQTELISPKH